MEKNYRVCALASGSRGNAVYVSDGNTNILIDAGLSGAEMQRRLISRNLSAENLDAIVVSHEHSDHIHGVGVLSRRYSLPVYMSRKTEAAGAGKMGKLSDVRYFECGKKFSVGSLDFRPFSTSHDAGDPAGFCIGEKKIGIATDLGIPTQVVREHLRGCALVMLEANHDPEMLMKGPYPWYLKQRVRSRTGHLSNMQSSALLREILHPELRHIILGHLSEKNNHPEKALAAGKEAINGHRIHLDLALQDVCGEVIRI
ncbi:MAG: MBL fold metallo-hydrolase [Desulfococcaceae bacterium]|jgi:phosphoribosyl 1,2-cyclic phosphodiesterase|nr:MBL fold metallo-hydrolase [Desulfococcaceae bacterium]